METTPASIAIRKVVPPICIALVPSETDPMIWNTCTHTALGNDCFCAEHRDALDGAVLGLCVRASEKEAVGSKAAATAKAAKEKASKQKAAASARSGGVTTA
jgi:hypothetical protein